jgi:cytochrome c oxidase subunit 3/cytochrome o ubiquinol oxidase subunit 3
MATHEVALETQHHTSTGVDSVKMGMWAFLGSECLFFGSFITTYLLYRNNVIAGPTPDEIYDIPFTSVSSFVLLMSSLTMVLGLAAIQRRDERAMRVWLLATALLGSVFIGGQIYEFTTFVEEGLKLDTSTFGTSFFVLTGFHGAHVTIGILMLLGLVMMSMFGRLQPGAARKVEIIGLYWHFVDIVWIVIFTVVYLIPTGS